MTAIAKTLVRAARRWRDEPSLRAAAARSDAFLISYPKSGRTWLRYLLSCYLAELADLGFEPDLTTTFRVLPNFDRDPVRGIGAVVGKPHPLVLVSHLPYDRRLFGDRPVLFLIRDPRDVMVSAYFHATRHKHVFEGDIAQFLDNRHYGMPALMRYLNGWADGLAARPHLIVSYEEMMNEIEGVVSAILAFLRVEVRPFVLRRAIATASFDQMRDRERGQGIPGHRYDRTDDQSLRMRSGRAKAFSDWLDHAQSEAILDRCRTELGPRARELLAVTGIDLGVNGNVPPRPAVALATSNG